MVHRKAPSLEEARELFLADPNKMLQSWADEWGVTHERVRQLRIESGVPQRGAYNADIADSILEIIKTGRGGLTTPRTYEDQPIGLERFKTWIEEEEGLAEKVSEAQKLAAKSLKDPIEKECKYCKEWKPVEDYKRNQKYLDGLTKFCIICIDILKEKKSKIGDEKLKLCLSCKQEKKVSEFSKNPNAPDSLRIFCKNCHKAQKRKQRRQARKFNA
tara:strand:+ start:1294 stop:1941 length:648 start_codon:yes stop_codon:yes gene_type:complete